MHQNRYSLKLVEKTMLEQILTPWPEEEPTLEQLFPEGIAAHEDPMQEQGKNMRRKKQQTVVN